MTALRPLARSAIARNYGGFTYSRRGSRQARLPVFDHVRNASSLFSGGVLEGK